MFLNSAVGRKLDFAFLQWVVFSDTSWLSFLSVKKEGEIKKQVTFVIKCAQASSLLIFLQLCKFMWFYMAPCFCPSLSLSRTMT